MLFSVEDPKESTKKLLELIDEFTRFHLSIRLLSRVNALLTHVSGFLGRFLCLVTQRNLSYASLRPAPACPVSVNDAPFSWGSRCGTPRRGDDGAQGAQGLKL